MHSKAHVRLRAQARAETQLTAARRARTGFTTTRRTVLDDAHVGDIRGALGTLKQHAHAPRTRKRRLLALLAVMGPGLIVMVGDNDAGGVATYAQAGQNYGLTLLWTLVLLIPVLIVNQEMVVRLGAVTGVGHARLIIERFGKFWGAFSVGDLFILNFLTIVTEFIGVSLALGYFGVSKYIAVPVAALALIAMTLTGSFRRWERFMCLFVITNFLAIPLALMSHPHAARSSPTPPARGPGRLRLHLGAADHRDRRDDRRAVAAVLSAVKRDRQADHAAVDQLRAGRHRDRLDCRDRWRRRADDRRRVRVRRHPPARPVRRRRPGRHGDLAHAWPHSRCDVRDRAAQRLDHRSGSRDAGELLRVRRRIPQAALAAPRHRPGEAFHGSYAAMVLLAAAIVLIPDAPLGTITTAVQALAGVLLPSATVFLLLLCNDKDVLGPWTNPGWLNAIASAIVGVLVVLSAILTATVLFPQIDVTLFSEVLFGVLACGLAGAGVYVAREDMISRSSVPAGRTRSTKPTSDIGPRDSWTMPQLELLDRPVWSRTRKIGMLTLRGYLVVAVLMLIVKAIEVGVGH